MLVIFATHPIQYQVPLWRKMTEAGIGLEVWYFTDFGTKVSYDVQFGKSFSWDLPMLEGYKYRFLKVNENAVPNEGFRGIILKENLRKLLKEHNVTHIYINGWQVFAYWQALWAAKSLGLKVIFKGESNDLKPENKRIWPLKKLLMGRFFSKIDYFLYIGKANKRLYQNRYQIKDKKLLPGLYCVDNGRFHQEKLNLKNDIELLRKNWGIADDAFCILFSGKFISKKRPLDLIEAVKVLAGKVKIHLLYVGDGELYNDLKRSAHVVYDKEKGIVDENNKLEVKISIVGFLNQTEIPKAYSIADCLVLPSNYGETWGLVVNEAMASSIPAIVSNQCGSAEDLVKPINTQLTFETGNINELAKSINWLIENPVDKNLILEQINKYTYQSTIQSVKKIINP